MKILIVGDYRSPNLQSILSSLQAYYGIVYVASTSSIKNSSTLFNITSIFNLSNFFSKKTGCAADRTESSQRSYTSNLKYKLAFNNFFSQSLYGLLYLFRLLELPFLVHQLRNIITTVKPDLIIAYRTQMEGYIVCLSGFKKYIVFTQGSDLSYFALSNSFHFWLTKATLRNSSGLIADTRRDLYLANRFFIKKKKPSIISLGNGGLTDEYFSPSVLSRIPYSILCARPPAPYIDLKTLFHAVSIVSSHFDLCNLHLSLIAPIHQHNFLIDYAADCGFPTDCLYLHDFMPKSELKQLMRNHIVSVSPSLTDGIPVSFLESISCGCFPIASYLDSLEEIIINGSNGFLYPKHDARALANHLITSLSQPTLCLSAFEYSCTNILPHYSKSNQTRILTNFLSQFVF